MEEQLINLKLVTEVEKYPCLYNSDLPSYSRRDITEDAWSKVGNVMQMPVHACKEKWKNLRIVFMRCLKAVSVPGCKRKPYYLFDVMQFLVPHMKQNVASDLLVSTYESRHSESKHFESKESDSFKDSNDTTNEDIEIKHEFDESGSESCVNEYKKRRLDETDINNISDLEWKARSERPVNEVVQQMNDPVVSFLNSLVPELNEMNFTQFKIFKRRALALIDNIKGDVY